MTSFREPTLYQIWMVTTGALGFSTSRTFKPLLSTCSCTLEATSVAVCEADVDTVDTRVNRRRTVMTDRANMNRPFIERDDNETLGMLPMGGDRHQGQGKVSQLSACPEHVPALGFPYEDVEAPLVQDLLEPHDVLIRRPPEFRAGKFIERNQVDLAAQALQELRQRFRVLLRIVDTREQNIFERQTAVGRQRIRPAGSQQSVQG